MITPRLCLPLRIILAINLTAVALIVSWAERSQQKRGSGKTDKG